MQGFSSGARYSALIALGALSLVLSACGSDEKTATTAPAATDAAPAPASGQLPAAPAPDAAALLAPEALEDLLAPIALYPDVIVGHVLAASTNPQEVLDAGNWLIQNQALQGKELDEAAQKLGLSTSMRALLQFPEVVDMMCMKLDWTTELGQAFNADQAAVLDAVQRLRKQAKDVGNLESSAQLKVANETVEGQEIITVSPPSPEVVYVPTYDPTAVYAPPPAQIPPPTTVPVESTAVVPATTTTTTTTTESSENKYSTGSLVTTGLLAFGAGLLVNEVFDDDDDWDDHYPHYGSPYYPPPPYMYRPPYGGGYYPSHNYNRPANYQRGFNNNTIIVNNQGKDYWNKYDGRPGGSNRRDVSSPITKAKPNRPELASLNQQSRERATRAQNQPREGGVAGAGTREAGRPQGGYAGATAEGRDARDKMLKSQPANVDRQGTRPGIDKQAGRPQQPKVQGTYAGASKQTRDKVAQNAKVANDSRTAARQSPAARPSKPVDRGHNVSQAQQRPQVDRSREAAQSQQRSQIERPQQQQRPSAGGHGGGGGGAFAGGSGNADRAASKRGHSSMSKGAQGHGKKRQR